MIVEVRLGDEEPRQYRIERDGFTFRVHRLDGGEPEAFVGEHPGDGGSGGSASPGDSGGPASGSGGPASGGGGSASASGGSAADGDSGGPAGNHDGALEIDWRRPEDGLYSLLVCHRSYEVFVDENEHTLTVHLLDRTFRVQAVDARRRRAMAAAAATDGAVRITAPIPGRVTRILAPAGSAVQEGDGVVVVEAMKMENELRSPRDGTVASIEVEEGQGVEGGALLAVIE